MEDRYMLLEEMIRDERNDATVKTISHNIIMSLESKFPISDDLKNTISSEKNIAILEKWFALSLTTASLEDFKQKMS